MKVFTYSQLATTCLSFLLLIINSRAFEISALICPTPRSITTVYVIQSIYISTHIAQNTTLGLNDNFSLTVTNAPTAFEDVVRATSTTIITAQDDVSDSSFHQVDSYSFVLNIFVPKVKHSQKRQSGGAGFVNGQGISTDSCSEAVIYTLVNGQLFANASSGVTQFGSDLGADYSLFIPRIDPGPVNTTFSVDAANNLLWANPAFYNTMAQYCILSNNSLVAVFVAPSQAPDNCVFVQLNMIRLSSCVANIQGPSGPAGSIGPTGSRGETGATGYDEPLIAHVDDH